MGRHCYLCKKVNYLHPTATYHRWPADPVKRNKWLTLCGFREGHVIPNSALICSDHFHEEDFRITKGGKKYLLKDALPELREKHPVSQFTTASVYRNVQENDPAKFICIQQLSKPSSEGDAVRELNCNQPIYRLVACPLPEGFRNSEESQNIENVPDISSRLKVEFGNSEESQNTNIENVPDISSRLKVEEPESLAEIEAVESSSTSTMSASETENIIIETLNDPNCPPEKRKIFLQLKSEFRGKLALFQPPKRRKRRYIGDITSEDFATPKEAIRHFKIMKSALNSKTRNVKVLKQNVRRLRARVLKLNTLVKFLKKSLRSR